MGSAQLPCDLLSNTATREMLQHRIVGQLAVSLSRTPDLGVAGIYWFTRAYIFPEVELPVPVQLTIDMWKDSPWSSLSVGYSCHSRGCTWPLSAAPTLTYLMDEFVPSVSWNYSTKQKTKRKKKIKLHFHIYALSLHINKQTGKKNSHQEMLFLVKATMNRKFSKACEQKPSSGILALLNSHPEFVSCSHNTYFPHFFLSLCSLEMKAKCFQKPGIYWKESTVVFHKQKTKRDMKVGPHGCCDQLTEGVGWR